MKICMSEAMAEAHGERVRALAPQAEIVCLCPDGSYRGDPAGIEVVLFTLDMVLEPRSAGEAAALLGRKGLHWVQSPGAGVDHPIFQDLLARGVRLTNASGINAEPIAQYVFTYVLHWERNVVAHQVQSRARHREIIVSEDLTAKTLGIVGLGGIGAAVARIAKAFGMRVLGMRRQPVADPNVDEWVPTKRLHDLLGASHFVVLALPFTDETRGMIGAPELAAMRTDGVLINVARGGVVDEPALIEALQARRIKGASLDVTAEEPLPDDSPLWSLDNCVVTPHDAGYSPLSDTRLAELFLDNLARYVRGTPLRNEVASSGLSRVGSGL